MKKAFSHFEWTNGFIGLLDRKFPSYFSAWTSEYKMEDSAASHYLYVHKGTACLVHEGKTHQLYQGMFASVPGSFQVVGGEGIIVSRENNNCMFQLGSIEFEGRLKYIDGCTDSLLLAPWKLGEPCLNLLYFPKNIDQTSHTHPSDRIGMVLSGKGECVAVNDGAEEVINLEAGMLFCIHTDGVHKFRTLRGEHMRVLAFHPDSDFGPEDQYHPMINRTIVDGVSANQIEEIRTK